MLITIFFALLLLAGIGVVYGFYKINVPIYLLGAGVITLIGIIAIGEGLALDSTQIVSDGETIFETTPEILTVDTSLTARLLGYGTFYGGLFLSAMGVLVSILWFWRNALPGGQAG